MKDFFYILISVLIIFIAYNGYKHEKQFEQKRFNNSIVVEKQDDFIYGLTMYFKYENDSVVSERVYQVFYDKYNIGDTVKCPAHVLADTKK